MTSREHLESLNCDELRTLAKKLRVKRHNGHTRLRKGELINQLLKREADEEFIRSIKMAKESDKKIQYLDTVSIGTLVAFAYEGGAKSAKIINRSVADRKLEVETEYGAKIFINYEDVLWVKTGARWPRGVYSLLKFESRKNQA